ncbi:MAG: 4Fe-4S dicluster domain-containing protein [Candidatus Thermoplasmatota archaeon]
MTYILRKTSVKELINELKKYEVYAPIKNDSIVSFSKFDGKNELYLDFINSIVPPKSILFPQTEKMFEFIINKEGINIKQNENKKEIVIFGIRPCDAKSFKILDPLFKEKYVDTYYQEKRDKLILIGLACNEPDINCFCPSFNETPYSTNGLDILLTDLGDRYTVDVITENGKKIIDENRKFFEKANDIDINKRNELHKSSLAKIKRKIEIDGTSEKLGLIYEHQFWSNIAKRCIGCGICTYSCPTCHCFDIQDEALGGKGRRVRIWDSCMYPEYTLQASGYNPRPRREDRIKNRVYHKYKWYFENFNTLACVGCGRCINNCPVNIDIIEILSIVKESKNE